MAHTDSKSLLDAPRVDSRSAVTVACALALGAHAFAAVVALSSARAKPRDVDRHVRVSELFAVSVETPREPALQAAGPPPAPKSLPRPTPIAKAARSEPAPEAAPAAAQAAQVLAQEPEDEVIDFGETIVQGGSSTYAGGVTEAGGTAAHAVRDARARALGIEGGTGSNLSGVDRSRAAALAGGLLWDCPFPEEAEDNDIDAAVVTLRVHVAIDGTLEGVEVTSDPGSGFGREARRCARDKRWQPARDRAGRPIASADVVNVRFSR